MEVMKAIKGRRSVRRFSDTPVRDNTIKDLIDAGQWAPSACNKQLWQFVIIRNRETLRKIVEQGHAVHFLRKAPVVIYVLYQKEAITRRSANIMSGSAAIQNMLLRAHETGLGSCWVNQLGDEQVVRRLLRIPDDMIIVSAVAFGYPAERPKPPRRRDIKSLVHLERYGPRAVRLGISPAKWSLTEWEDYRKRGIRATSPFPQAHETRFKREFRTEVRLALRSIKGERVLELLPFSGNYTSEIAKHVKGDVHVFDTSPEIIDFLRRRFKALGIKRGVRAKTGHLYRLPYQAGHFDTVMCFKRLEMLPDPAKILAEARRVLKPGGTLILTAWKTRNIYSLHYSLKTGLLGKNMVTSNEGPIKPLSVGSIRRMLRRNGFSIMEERGINLAPWSFGGFSMQGLSSGRIMKPLCRTVFFRCRKA